MGSEFRKSLMGLLLISIASLLALFLEPSSQFNNGLRPINPYDAFYGRIGEMGMGFNGFGYGVQDPSRVTVFPRSCKGNCDFNTIEFILKDGKECPAVYQSKNPPLDVMVRGQAQCNSTTESNEFPKLCSYCWIPKNEAMLEIGNAPSFGGVHQSSYGGEYKLKKICTYRPPESCNTWSLVKGTCSDCS